MSRFRTPLLARLLVPCGLLGFVLAPTPAHAADAPVKGVHHNLPRMHRAGVAAPATTGSSVIDVVVPLHLSPAASQGIAQLAKGPASALQRRAKLHALMPSHAQASRVTAWAGQHGFEVTSTTPWSVSLRGRANSLAAAFGTSMRTAGFGGKGFIAPRQAARVPAALTGVVDPVVGLDTRPIWSGHAAYGGGDVQVLNSTPVRGSAGGAGATVATVNLSGWHTSDLTTYRRAAFGSSDVAPTVTPVVVSGGHVLATVEEDDFGDEVEVALDAEAIAGVAPAAQQRMYFGGNSSAGYIAILDQMAADLLDADTSKHFQTASTSWGACELAIPTSDLDAMRTAINMITAAGSTFFAASGDGGAYDCGDGLTPAVDFPASAENTVAVGGTTVTGAAPSYTSTAWDGSGGGCSAVISAPARQALASNPCSGRAVPDIATLADPSSGLWVYDRVDEWVPIGGTSVAAPASAAGLAAAEAHAGLTTLSTPFLTTAYQNPSAFTDVASGNNGLYRAGAGYDLVTGLGSPLWTAVEAALTSSPAPTPTGHNEPLLAVDPTSDPTTASLTVQTGMSSYEPAIVPNGEPVTAYAASGTSTLTDCSTATPSPPSNTSLPGTVASPAQVSLAVVSSGPAGCITVLRPVVVDPYVPVVPVPTVTYVGTTAPAYRFAWGPASDPTPSAGVLLYGVWVTDLTSGDDVAAFVTTGRAFPYAGDAPVKLAAGHGYRVEVDALDGAFNIGYHTATFIAPYDDTKATYSKHLSGSTYVSDWSRAKSTADYLGSHATSARKGAYFGVTFTAKTATIGVFKSPAGGYADVYVDGVRRTRISLYATKNLYRQPVRVASYSTSGKHTLKVVVVGAHTSASKGNYVYLDSITLGI